jgi:predicted RND superfamily exporter protein
LYFLRIGHVPLDAIEDLLSVGIVVAFLSALILLALVIYSAAPILPVLAAIASKQREEWTAWFGVQGRFRTVAFALATVCAPWLALFVMFVPMEGAPLESKWWICTALLCGSLARIFREQ